MYSSSSLPKSCFPYSPPSTNYGWVQKYYCPQTNPSCQPAPRSSSSSPTNVPYGTHTASPTGSVSSSGNFKYSSSGLG